MPSKIDYIHLTPRHDVFEIAQQTLRPDACNTAYQTPIELWEIINRQMEEAINRQMKASILYRKGDIIATEKVFGYSKPNLDNIFIQPDKDTVVAKKDDGDIIKIQSVHGDEFDPYIGVALALAYKQFGSKAAFRKAVDKITPKPKKKKVKHTVKETVYADNKPLCEADRTIRTVKQDKYEVGDKILIVPDADKVCAFDDGHSISNPGMSIWSNCILTVSGVIHRHNRHTIYTVEENGWYWHPEHIVGKVVEER